MSFRKIPSDSLATEFNRVYDEINKLKKAVSGRVLPVGYSWRIGDADELIVVRDDDDTEVTVLS